MEIKKTRHVDSDESNENGIESYFYEYDFYEFTSHDLCFIARSYTDTPNQVHFLRKKVSDHQTILSVSDFINPLMIFAIQILRAEGKSDIQFFSPEQGGYIPIPIGYKN